MTSPSETASSCSVPSAEPAATTVSRSAELWRIAVKDTIAVASGMIAFGLVLGITVDVLGRSALAHLIGAGAIYGGSAQLTAVTLLSHGSGIVIAVASSAVVQLRLLLYSAAMGEKFAGQPRLFRWLAPHFIIDQTFIVAQGRPELTGAAFRGYWLRLGFLVLAVWTSSVSTGLFLGPQIPPLPHLTLVCAAMFIGLLVPRLTSKPAFAAAAWGAASAMLIGHLVPSLGIIAGVVAGMAAGSSAADRSENGARA